MDSRFVDLENPGLSTTLNKQSYGNLLGKNRQCAVSSGTCCSLFSCEGKVSMSFHQICLRCIPYFVSGMRETRGLCTRLRSTAISKCGHLQVLRVQLQDWSSVESSSSRYRGLLDKDFGSLAEYCILLFVKVPREN